MSKVTKQIKQDKMQKLTELLAPARISEGEKNTLKTIFGDSMEPYKVLRDLMFGFEITEGEKNIVSSLKIIKPLLRKIFTPKLSKDIAIGQNFDLWQTQDIKTATEDNFETVFEAKEKLIEMLETAFKRLDNPDDNQVSLEITKSLPHLIARSSYISYVDSQVRFLMRFTNMDSLTPEERLKMMQMESSK